MLDESQPQQPSALSGVFRRIGDAPAAPELAPGPPQGAAARVRPAPAPQLLGFAEPVTQVPPIEGFLSPAPESEPGRPVQPALAAIPERACEPPPERVPPSPAPPERPRNLVGRLGRRLGDAVTQPLTTPTPHFALLPDEAPPRPSSAPRFGSVPTAAPPSSPVPGEPASEPTSKPAAAPAQQPVAPDPVPSPADRGGRPSLSRNRRLYRRAKLPAEIEIGGVPCTLINVSIGGFGATGVPQIEPNAVVPVTIRLVIDGIEIGTQLTARVIYVTQGRSSARFIDLSPSQMAFLRYIVTWRGESVGAVGTTTLLDAITGGGERGSGPDANDPSSDDAPKSRWWDGLIGRKVDPPR